MRYVSWLLAVWLMAAGPSAFALGVGDAVPTVSFTDIDGVAASVSRYDGWVQVFTFADRESSDRMVQWLNDAGIEVARKFPAQQIAYIGFADMRIVPRLLQGVALPLLRQVNKRSMSQMDGVYEKAGVKRDKSRIAFHLTPDWDGTFLKAFGLSDAVQWKCWIAAGGRIIAALDESTPEVAKRYVAAFEEAEAAMKSKAPAPVTVP